MFVGIDISKDWVDVAVHPTGETLHVGLDEKSVDGLVRKLRDLAPQIVVMEATGGYEAELSAAIWTAGRPRRRRQPAPRPGLCALPGHTGEDRSDRRCGHSAFRGGQRRGGPAPRA